MRSLQLEPTIVCMLVVSSPTQHPAFELSKVRTNKTLTNFWPMTTTTTTIYICGFALSHSAYLEYTPPDTKQTCPWISGHHSINRVAKFQVFQKNGCLEFCDLTLLYIINPQWENNCVDKKEVDCVPSMLLCSPHSYKANICRGVEWLGISMSAKVSHLLDVVR
jgi:hypothetical protein